MNCKLKTETIEVATHYIGSTGNLYDINKFHNWGGGVLKKGKNDLPNEYPFTLKYETRLKYECCKHCNCN